MQDTGNCISFQLETAVPKSIKYLMQFLRFSFSAK